MSDTPSMPDTTAPEHQIADMFEAFLGRRPNDEHLAEVRQHFSTGSQLDFVRLIDHLKNRQQILLEERTARYGEDLIGGLIEAVLGHAPTEARINEVRTNFSLGNDIDYPRFISHLLNQKRQRKQVPVIHRPGHFYSPITDPDLVKPFLDALDRQVKQVTGINIDGPRMAAFWEEISAPLEGRQPFPDTEAEAEGFWFENPAYSYGDATALHCILRHAKPKRVVEVGSGYSSMCLLETRKKYLGEDVEVTFVEPYADLLRKLIGGQGQAASNLSILEDFVQDVPMETFTRLEANDILFIDSTHVIKTGSDVAHELGEILPRLRPGVFVHFHDIHWPFEYPPNWAVGLNRSWNEAYGLRYLLAENPNWEIVLFNDYLRIHYAETVTRTAPWFSGNWGGSIWLRRLG